MADKQDNQIENINLLKEILSGNKFSELSAFATNLNENIKGYKSKLFEKLHAFEKIREEQEQIKAQAELEKKQAENEIKAEPVKEKAEEKKEEPAKKEKPVVVEKQQAEVVVEENPEKKGKPVQEKVEIPVKTTEDKAEAKVDVPKVEEPKAEKPAPTEKARPSFIVRREYVPEKPAREKSGDKPWLVSRGTDQRPERNGRPNGERTFDRNNRPAFNAGDKANNGKEAQDVPPAQVRKVR